MHNLIRRAGGVLSGRGGKIAPLGSQRPDAITLGRLVEGGQIGAKMNYGGERHILVLGPNGTGKGTRLLVPCLLQCQDRSIFVIDPKAELSATTSPYRRTLGDVVIINPFGVLTDRPGYADLESEGFNPFLGIDPDSPSFNSDAALLADAIITVEGRDPHWDISARALVAAFIMYAVIKAKKRRAVATMTDVRAMICEAVEQPDKLNSFLGTGIPAYALEMMRERMPAGLRNKASQFSEWTNEISSIASSARRQTETFDDEKIKSDMEKPGFDFRVMKEKPVTVYVILPPEMMDRHAKWLRLIVSSAMRATLRVRKPSEPRLLYMLDEFAALGHMQVIETAWSLVRGYGIQIMPVLQDIHQLKGLYKDRWETFIGMAGAMTSFTPNDMTTAKFLSERAGETTRVVTGFHRGSGESDRGHGSTSTSHGINWQQVKMPLLSPHQLFGLPPGYMLTTLAGLSNIVLTYAPSYWEIRQCRDRARTNPYFI